MAASAKHSSDFQTSFEQSIANDIASKTGRENLLSTILDANLPKDGADDSTSICSETMLLDENLYYTPTSSRPSSPAETWASDSPSEMSLVVGDGPQSVALRDQIALLVPGHDVQLCRQEEAFDHCSSRTYQLIWLQMSNPANQEMLSLTTSIRYASKLNRRTLIIGLADNAPDVDLRLHGIDEVVVDTVTKAKIRQAYTKWTSVQLIGECPDSPSTDDLSFSAPSTPASDETEPANGSDPNGEAPNFAALRTFASRFNIQQQRPRAQTANDHTSKEKLRRERIKDSCDQLRVLLPYIRGRKTDMASILEMCVDYLKIVNSALTEEFQRKVIEILSKDCRATVTSDVMRGGRGEPRGSRRMKREAQPPESPSTTKVTSTVEQAINGVESLQPPSVAEVYGFPCEDPVSAISDKDDATTPQKRDSPQLYDSKACKRFRQQPLGEGLLHPGNGGPYMYPHTNAQLNFYEATRNLRDDIPDAQRDDAKTATATPSSSSFSVPHAQMYADLDSLSRLYTGNDGYSAPTYYTGHLPGKAASSDRESYGIFMDSAPLYHYYAGMQTGNGAMYSSATGSEYVNPNAVLPASYNGRFSTTTTGDSNRYASETDNAKPIGANEETGSVVTTTPKGTGN